MIRTSGHMWGPDGKEADTLAVIPDSSYAGIYQVVIDDCRANGAYDPATMGSVPNVGLMAQAAEEYGSHDKTFEIPDRRHRPRRRPGRQRRPRARGRRRRHLAHVPDQGRRRSGTGSSSPSPAPARPATRPCSGSTRAARTTPTSSRRSRRTCPSTTPTGLQIEIMAPVDAIEFSLERIRRGEDTISVTGNVLRDYLTDLFPILELGTSAKMLSVVPLIERRRPVRDRRRRLGARSTSSSSSRRTTCAGTAWASSSRWPPASSTSRRPPATRAPRSWPTRSTAPPRTFLNENKSPSRRVGGIDNRGSHFYLALYWAQELAAQTDDAELAEAFARARRDAGRAGADDRRRAARGAGLAGRHRRLLPARPGQGRGRHAPVGDAQRGARHVGLSRSAPLVARCRLRVRRGWSRPRGGAAYRHSPAPLKRGAGLWTADGQVEDDGLLRQRIRQPAASGGGARPRRDR